CGCPRRLGCFGPRGTRRGPGRAEQAQESEVALEALTQRRRRVGGGRPAGGQGLVPRPPKAPRRFLVRVGGNPVVRPRVSPAPWGFTPASTTLRSRAATLRSRRALPRRGLTSPSDRSAPAASPCRRPARPVGRPRRYLGRAPPAPGTGRRPVRGALRAAASP